MVSFIAQRRRGHGLRRPPAPARGAARGARRLLAQGRLLAVGPVRMLHGARRRQGGGELQALAGRRSRARRSPRSKACPTSERDRAARRRSRRRGALQCGFCTPGILVRVAALLDKKGAGLDRDDRGPPPRRPPVPLHRLREDPRRGRAARQGRDRSRVAPARRHRHRAARRYQGFDLALGDKRVRRRPAPCPACCTARCASPTTPAPTSWRIDTDAPRPRARASCACSPRPTSPASCASGSSTRTGRSSSPKAGAPSYLGDVLAVRRGRRPRRRPARGRRARRGRVPRAARRSPTRSPRSTDAEDAVWELDGNVLSRSAYARGDVDAALAASAHVVHEVFQTQRIEHAFLEPESTLAVPEPDGTLHVYSGGQGVWDDRDQIASVLGIEPQRDHRRAGRRTAARSAARRTWQPGADRAGRLPARRAGEVHAVARGVAAHPPQAPPDPHRAHRAGCDADGKLTALRARMVGDSGPVRVGRA